LNAACLLYKRQKVISKRLKKFGNFSSSWFVLSQPCAFQSLTPTSDNSRYYIVFKDKKGRYFCEFCAPPETRKVNDPFPLRLNTHHSFAATQLKKQNFQNLENKFEYFEHKNFVISLIFKCNFDVITDYERIKCTYVFSLCFDSFFHK